MPRRQKARTHAPAIAVIGYGSQGRAIARNLHDHGFRVRVGLRSRSLSRKLVQKDGLPATASISDAVRESSVVIFAVPDHVQGAVYAKELAPYVRKGQTLLFLHGLAIHFKLIVPPPGVAVMLLAPHAPGVAVREAYLGTRQVSAFYAFRGRITPQIRAILYQIAEGIGIRKENLVKTSFRHEAIGDLFGEQAVLCGGLTGLIMAGFNQLLKAGIPPRNAYLEVAYQLDLIISLIKKHGIVGMYERISVAARYGSVQASKMLIDKGVQERMAKLYSAINSGEFPRRLAGLTDRDLTQLNRTLRTLSSPAFERAVRATRQRGD